VDVALSLLERAGDFCSEDIWHRVVQLVTNTEGMQVGSGPIHAQKVWSCNHCCSVG
jgi:AP-2 complex subunit alpha